MKCLPNCLMHYYTKSNSIMIFHNLVFFSFSFCLLSPCLITIKTKFFFFFFKIIFTKLVIKYFARIPHRMIATVTINNIILFLNYQRVKIDLDICSEYIKGQMVCWRIEKKKSFLNNKPGWTNKLWDYVSEFYNYNFLRIIRSSFRPSFQIKSTSSIPMA